MEYLIKLFVLGTLVLGVLSSQIQGPWELPALDAWWGLEELRGNCDTSIQPFEMTFEENMIRNLKDRLNNHRSFTPPLKGAAFTYGFNTDNMDSWIDYWVNSYNFKEREAFLNQFPQYKTNIQGIDMHFIWVKPEVAPNVEVIPVLMLHGWPGSIREFYEAIPLITAVSDDRDFAVEVIVPNLPGFGSSSGAVRPGFGYAEIAVVLRNMMHRLGHKKFYIQGGDWGAFICNSIATQFPNEILGYHANFAVSFVPSTFATWFLGSINSALQSTVVKTSLADRLYPILTIIKGAMEETGYLHLQATKPDTIGVAMSDSPSGLLAYILQIVSWASRSDNKYLSDGGIDELYSRDKMIDNLMIYWVYNAFTTAVRIYAESFNMRNVKMGLFAFRNRYPWFCWLRFAIDFRNCFMHTIIVFLIKVSTPVPTWTTHTKYEILYQSPVMLKYKFPNLLNSTVYDEYGHFFALEAPEVFSESVLEALGAFRHWHERNDYNNEL